jgi:ferredoxin
MSIAALIERRNLAWPETAAMVAGLDLLRIHAEHHARPEEVETYLLRVRGFIHEGLDDGWDGVVWGDIDPADPLRSLEIDREACEGCGRCVIVCPQAFARAKGGEIVVKSPTAVRQKDLEESCLEAVSECPEGAIRLNSRGGRTATGVLPPRGRPLPGERQD